MKVGISRLHSIGFILWHARHMVYHILIGLVWAWFLRERWHEFRSLWIWIAVMGSVLPDIDHVFYYFGYGKNDGYNRQIANFVNSHQWRTLTVFLEQGHKHNTNLSFHNIYVMGIFLVGSITSSLFDWQIGVILFGAICSHYLFDMWDDVVQLGTLNSNWKRWGRVKTGSL